MVTGDRHFINQNGEYAMNIVHALLLSAIAVGLFLGAIFTVQAVIAFFKNGGAE